MQYEEIQTRKLLSAYGGPGSIVETRSGAVIIEPFSDWPAFQRGQRKEPIDDPRLVQRLRNWFPRLERLVKMPVNGLAEGFRPERPNATVKARYFPEWMFSPVTRRFDKLENWHRLWIHVTNKYNDNNARDSFHPPKCFTSYDEAKSENKKRKYYELEQVRFIMISPNGHIADVPWDRWVFAQTNQAPDRNDHSSEEKADVELNERNGNIWLDFEKEMPQNVYYRYVVSDERSDLSGIAIFAHDTQTDKIIKRQSLTGLFNLRVPQKLLVGPFHKHGNDLMKVVIRSSNSVYYPNVVQSLYLPVEPIKSWTDEIIDMIKNLYRNGQTDENIATVLKITQQFDCTAEQVKSLIQNDFKAESQNAVEVEEEAYRKGEYNFITSHTGRFQDGKNCLTLEPMPSLARAVAGLKNIYRLDRLKVTSVQTSYTRQEPIDSSLYLHEDDMERTDGIIIRKRYTSKWKKDTIKYFPAVENFGEGLFFDFDQTALQAWLMGAASVEIAARTQIIHENYDRNRMGHVARTIESKFLLIHTFSHLLIKELEFLCGYPASSLQERLYVGAGMQGLLIYTVAGAEGSFGGLTLLAKSDSLIKLMNSALLRARDCASDPICLHTGDDGKGQGVGGTNLAACYSCAMLPETSCEEFNRFLDRKMVIDDKIGFFGAQAT